MKRSVKSIDINKLFTAYMDDGSKVIVKAILHSGNMIRLLSNSSRLDGNIKSTDRGFKYSWGIGPIGTDQMDDGCTVMYLKPLNEIIEVW